jgi:hypothetical protein
MAHRCKDRRDLFPSASSLSVDRAINIGATLRRNQVTRRLGRLTLKDLLPARGR